MPETAEVLDKVKASVRAAAYTTAGLPLLVSDAIAGREVPTPGFAADQAAVARRQAGAALGGLRSFTEPRTDRLVATLPEPVAKTITSGRRAMWERLGVELPQGDDDTHAEADSAEDEPTAGATAENEADETAAGDGA